MVKWNLALYHYSLQSSAAGMSLPIHVVWSSHQRTVCVKPVKMKRGLCEMHSSVLSRKSYIFVRWSIIINESCAWLKLFFKKATQTSSRWSNKFCWHPKKKFKIFFDMSGYDHYVLVSCHKVVVVHVVETLRGFQCLVHRSFGSVIVYSAPVQDTLFSLLELCVFF